MLARKRVDPIVGDVFVKALDAVNAFGSFHGFWPFVFNVVTLLYIQNTLFCTFQKSFRRNF